MPWELRQLIEAAARLILAAVSCNHRHVDQEAVERLTNQLNKFSYAFEHD